MGAELSQHVVQEGDPSVDLVLPSAIEVEMHLNVRFVGAAVNRGRPGLQ
jgi:hypothetical protein